MTLEVQKHKEVPDIIIQSSQQMCTIFNFNIYTCHYHSN